MPTYFNAALDLAGGKFWEIAQRKQWGWKLTDGSYLAILLYADNYWLIARSHRVLQEMTETWLQCLAEFGWDTPLS
eukprot:642411-Lingulodinium_polyedra.AAC.1